MAKRDLFYRRLIMFLIRRMYRLKKYENFQFTNQKSDATYWFGDHTIFREFEDIVDASNVKFNWILDPNCKIRKCE